MPRSVAFSTGREASCRVDPSIGDARDTVAAVGMGPMAIDDTTSRTRGGPTIGLLAADRTLGKGGYRPLGPIPDTARRHGETADPQRSPDASRAKLASSKTVKGMPARKSNAGLEQSHLGGAVAMWRQGHDRRVEPGREAVDAARVLDAPISFQMLHPFLHPVIDEIVTILPVVKKRHAHSARYLYKVHQEANNLSRAGNFVKVMYHLIVLARSAHERLTLAIEA